MEKYQSSHQSFKMLQIPSTRSFDRVRFTLGLERERTSLAGEEKRMIQPLPLPTKTLYSVLLLFKPTATTNEKACRLLSKTFTMNWVPLTLPHNLKAKQNRDNASPSWGGRCEAGCESDSVSLIRHLPRPSLTTCSKR